ncbi:MAG: hypothetical protein HEQ23_07000 [Tepidisphaera sp.]
MSSADQDDATTKAVVDALRQGNTNAANAAIQAACKIPDLERAMTLGDAIKANEAMREPSRGLDPSPVSPVLQPGMSEDLLNGSTKFYSIFLYDNCVEDGDIVRVEINKQPFAMVPLTRTGATLSIPVNSGQAFEVEIFGIRDGGGGITVACQTSNGAYFARAIQPGERAPLTFVPAKQ